MNLPEEILNLRIPISRLFVVVAGNEDEESSPTILIWHHIQKYLRGGRPVERLVRQMIGEELLKDNEQALEELKSLVEIFLESRKRNSSTRGVTTNNNNRIPTPPATISNYNKTQLFQHLRRPESARFVQSTSLLGDSSSTTSSSISTKTTFESFIESIKSKLESTNSFLDNQQPQQKSSDLNLLPQIHMYLQRENAALLADAEDVRRLIAGKPPALLSTSSNFSDDTGSEIHSQSNNNNNNVLSTSSSPSTFHRPATATCSSRATVSSAEATPIKSLTNNNSAPRQVISEITTSRVRAVLLARMNQGNHEQEEEEEEEQQQKVDEKSPKRGVFGEEVDEDEDDEIPDGLF
jgi:hypothetical protein